MEGTFPTSERHFDHKKGKKIKQPLFPMPSVSSLATHIIIDLEDSKAGQLNPEALVTAKGNRMCAIRAMDSDTVLVPDLFWICTTSVQTRFRIMKQNGSMQYALQTFPTDNA